MSVTVQPTASASAAILQSWKERLREGERPLLAPLLSMSIQRAQLHRPPPTGLPLCWGLSRLPYPSESSWPMLRDRWVEVRARGGEAGTHGEKLFQSIYTPIKSGGRPRPLMGTRLARVWSYYIEPEAL